MHRAIALRASNLHARPVQAHRNASLDAFRYARARDRDGDRERGRENAAASWILSPSVSDPFALTTDAIGMARTRLDA